MTKKKDFKKEEAGLIPDRWILGTGLETDGLYIIHADAPFLLLKYPYTGNGDDDSQQCTIYMRGAVDPQLMDRLINEAWEIVEGYRSSINKMHASAGKVLKRLN